jgi:ubiquinone/menaquinone biosynthesis C-methylase UbiE
VNNNKIKTAYDLKSSLEYDQRRFQTPQGRLFHALEYEQLEKVLAKLPKGARVLEVGCGSGRFVKLLGERGFQIWAVEPSSTMLDVSADKCRKLNNVTLLQGEGAHLCFPASCFDFVYSIRVTNQTESKDYAFRMIREMVRVSKPGGYVLIEFVNNNRLLKKKTQAVRLSFGEIGRLLLNSNAYVEQKNGILIYSQSLLDMIPEILLSLWGPVERWSMKALWRWASRGYVIARKK